MISRRRIIIRTGQIRHAKTERRIHRRIVQIQLRSSCAVRQRLPIPRLIPVLRARVPDDFPRGRAGRDAVVGVVGDGVELVGTGEGEDFAPRWEEVIVCHVGGGVGEGPPCVGVDDRGDGEVVGDCGGGVGGDGDGCCGVDGCGGGDCADGVGGDAGGDDLRCRGCLDYCGYGGG